MSDKTDDAPKARCAVEYAGSSKTNKATATPALLPAQAMTYTNPLHAESIHNPENVRRHPLFAIETVPAMLERTVAALPDREAFRQFDYQENAWISTTWQQFHQGVMRWRRAFTAMGLKPGDRVAMLLTNSVDAVTFDQAALACGLVPVPLHAIDTPWSSAYILKDSESRCLVTTSRARWNAIHSAEPNLPDLLEVVFTNEIVNDVQSEIRLTGVEDWLARGNGIPDEALPPLPGPDDLAGFIYTSGTTGRPKGVMITHRNIASNVKQILLATRITEEDVYLSFLPFSHTFERTVAHYVSVATGAAMAFARSVQHIENDLADVKPTVMCSVPRVFERIYQKIQVGLHDAPERERYLYDWALEAGWRRFCRENDLPVEPSERANLDETVLAMLDEEVGEKVRAVFGGRLSKVFAGGASLNYTVAKFFCSMGISMRQVYGLTETTPIVSFTPHALNHPDCVGWAVADTEVRLGDNDELQVKGPQVMKGYWKKPKETAAAFTEDGWFRTGDQADLSDGGRVRIKGRLKEIIVTSTGEKISPVDLEFAIQEDHLFEQVLAIGENRPFISAIVVVNDALWRKLCDEMQLDADDPATLTARAMTRLLVKRVRAAAKDFPSYGIPRAVAVVREPFTVEEGLLTPTMKPKRKNIAQKYAHLIEALYAGHKSA